MKRPNTTLKHGLGNHRKWVSRGLISKKINFVKTNKNDRGAPNIYFSQKFLLFNVSLSGSCRLEIVFWFSGSPACWVCPAYVPFWKFSYTIFYASGFFDSLRSYTKLTTSLNNNISQKDTSSTLQKNIDLFHILPYLSQI